MARRRSSYIPLGVVTRGLGISQPSSGINIASRGLIINYALEGVGPPVDALLSTIRFDSNGTQRLLSDDITALHFCHVHQELFANPDREYTGYGANGLWYTAGVLDPTHVPFKASWASEGEGEPTSVRGNLDRFPKRLITVATFREVALFDADTLDLWMRFVIGPAEPLGAGRLVGGPATRIRDAVFTNGFLVLATNFGLRIANFRVDRGFRVNEPDAQSSGNLGLAARNSDTFLDQSSTTSASLRLLSSDCLSLDAGSFSSALLTSGPSTKGVRTVAAVGHPEGITALRLDDVSSSFPTTVRHRASFASGNGWEVEDDGDLDSTSPFFVDHNFGSTNWASLGVQPGDQLKLDSTQDRTVLAVENIQPGRRLAVHPELSLTDGGSSYDILRPVRAVLISPELHLYFASGSGALAVVRDPVWATTPDTVFSTLNVIGNNFSPLSALPESINDLAKRGEELLAATSLGVFVVSDEDLDGRRLAEFRYSTPAVTSVTATYKILQGEDSNCEAISVDPETGNIQVAVSGSKSVVSDINPNIEQVFRFFDTVGYVRALATFRNPWGPPDKEVS